MNKNSLEDIFIFSPLCVLKFKNVVSQFCTAPRTEENPTVGRHAHRIGQVSLHLTYTHILKPYACVP